jgi:CSLREA domain-containing protein
MVRARFASLPMLFALLAASLFLPQLPVAQAAGPFVVTTTQDLNGTTCGSTCSLRQAINAAKSEGGNSEIRFNIPTSDPGYNQTNPLARTWTITLSANSPLPVINVDGIIIDGNSQASSPGGGGGNPNVLGPEIIIDGSNVTTRGGITINRGNNNEIRGLGIINFKGTPTNSFAGVGIEIIEGTGNKILGNYIGIDRTGTVAAGNNAAGIYINGGGNNIIGGDNTKTNEYNVISGNANDGILIRSSGNNSVIGNRIGTDAAGVTSVQNAGSGVHLDLGANNNTIGTTPNSTSPINSNIISGNGDYGVFVTESNTNGIYGNLIGINVVGSKLQNGQGGVYIFSTTDETAGENIIGGSTSSAANIISGNNGPGVAIVGPLANGNQVTNNVIGINREQTIPTGEGANNTLGVLISGGGDSNVIQNNIIGSSGGDGVRISGVSNNLAASNVISGNYIGVAPNGTSPLTNSGSGIVLENNVERTTIGGTTAEQRNIVANNGSNGIDIRGTNVVSTTIQRNTIQSNNGHGVTIANARSTLISGADAATLNSISNNRDDGIFVTNSISTTVRYNTLFGNQNGVHITGSDTTTATIQLNTIGSSQASSNAQNGVLVENGARSVSIAGNKIQGNGLNGVLVAGNTQRVSILGNSFSLNSAKGIELAEDTENTNGSALLPNHDINPPFDLRLNQTGQITGRVLADKTKPASCITCTIELFTSAGDGEGRDKLDVPVEISSNGYFTATLATLPSQVLATATDALSNTSEFAVLDVIASIKLVPTGPVEQTAAPSQTITYTFDVVNDGTLDFANNDLTLSAGSDKGWTIDVQPEALSLRAGRDGQPGESKPVTLTLTLPSGSDERVRAGVVDTSYITVTSTVAPATTASASVRTTVAPRFVPEITPPTRSGSGLPTSEIAYAHTIRNAGNISGTVTLTASSFLPNGSPAVGYTTTITPTSFVLEPGQSVDVTANVTIPEDAVTTSPPVTTIITATITSAAGNLTRTITDTTRVTLQPQATLVFDQEEDAVAGATVPFQHTLTNTSNGPATFKLFGSSSLGSTIRFRSDTPGVTIGPDGTVRLGITPGNNILTFYADVTVSTRAREGQTDLITIGVTTEDGDVIGGASVRDRIRVVANALLPRVYFPTIFTAELR